MQVMQDKFRFVVKYANPFHDVGLSKISFDRGDIFLTYGHGTIMLDYGIIVERAEALFCERRSTYAVTNLSTKLLFSRAIVELTDVDLSTPQITLSNGCCTLPDCPTTVFLGCVIDAIADYHGQ